MELVIGGKYRHYKGNEYHVLAKAKHSENQEEMVVYQEIHGEQRHWVRPLESFLQFVVVSGQETPRFKLLTNC